MALVEVIDNSINPGWNVGDLVEVKGKQLKKWLAKGKVILKEVKKKKIKVKAKKKK